MNHAPTQFDIRLDGTKPLIGTGENDIIAEVLGNSPEERRERAAFIVRACNSHEALVSALKAVRPVVAIDAQRYIDGIDYNSPESDNQLEAATADLQQLDDALKLAGE